MAPVTWRMQYRHVPTALQIPVSRLRVRDLADSPIDWSKFSLNKPQDIQLRKKKETIQKEWREGAKEGEGLVDEDIIAETVSKMTGIPLSRLEKKAGN